MSNHKNVDEIYKNGMTEFADNNLEKSIETLTQAAELDPGRKLTFVSRGAAYLQLGRVDEALADFNEAVDLDPKYARAFHLRGLAKEKKGDDAGAMEDISRAIDLDPEYGAAYYSRVTLYAKMGDEELATEDIAMVQLLTNKNIESFANDNNVWRSRQLELETIMETDLER